MAVVEELIREEEDGALSFGNYELPTKTKQDGFQYQGASYKIKTFNEITKLEKMVLLFMNQYLEQQYLDSVQMVKR